MKLNTSRMPVYLLLAVVASLIVTIFVMTSRHNAQLIAQTEVHNAQLIKQAETFGVQLKAQAEDQNAQLAAQSAAFSKPR